MTNEQWNIAFQGIKTQSPINRRFEQILTISEYWRLSWKKSLNNGRIALRECLWFLQEISQTRSFANVYRCIFRSIISLIRKIAISGLGKRDDSFGMRPDDRPSIEWLFGRTDNMADALSIPTPFEAPLKSYHLQWGMSAARAQLRKITANCFPFDERSSQKVVRRQC
jgi:hypothetical protein